MSNNLVDEFSEHLTKIYNCINLTCLKGAYNLAEIGVINKAMETLKIALEKTIRHGEQLEPENVSKLITTLTLALDKGCTAGAFTFETATNGKNAIDSLVKLINDKLLKKEESARELKR
jgi:hypothetical protein